MHATHWTLQHRTGRRWGWFATRGEALAYLVSLSVVCAVEQYTAVQVGN